MRGDGVDQEEDEMTKWELIGSNDFVRKIGMTGILRVEQMDRKNWWCAVYIRDKEIFNRMWYKTSKSAKQAAVRVYMKNR